MTSALLVLALLAPAHPVPKADPPLLGESIYQLDHTYVDQRGGKMRLDAFRGHPVVVAMFYGTCPHACPMLVSDVKRLEKALSPAARAETRVLLVSFDAERDTPEALANLVARHGMDPERWRLAAAADPVARELAAVLGVQYRKLADGGFGHSSVITVLDGQGLIVGRMEGAGQPLEAVVAAIEGAVAQGKKR